MSDDAALANLMARVKQLEDTLRRFQTFSAPANGIPSGGAAGQVLGWSGTAGIAAWQNGGMTLIEGKNANAGAVASFDFQSIPTTYSKLVIDLYARGDTAATSVATKIAFNADASAIYDSLNWSVHHSASLASSEYLAQTVGYPGSICAASAPASAFDLMRIEIPGYAITNGHKVWSSEASAKTGITTGLIYDVHSKGWYRSANAIARVTLTPNAGNFAQYSTARLYGVL